MLFSCGCAFSYYSAIQYRYGTGQSFACQPWLNLIQSINAWPCKLPCIAHPVKRCAQCILYILMYYCQIYDVQLLLLLHKSLSLSRSFAGMLAAACGLLWKLRIGVEFFFTMNGMRWFINRHWNDFGLTVCFQLTCLHACRTYYSNNNLPLVIGSQCILISAKLYLWWDEFLSFSSLSAS